MRNEFRQVERLRGMKCFPGDETLWAIIQYHEKLVNHSNRKQTND